MAPDLNSESSILTQLKRYQPTQSAIAFQYLWNQLQTRIHELSPNYDSSPFYDIASFILDNPQVLTWEIDLTSLLPLVESSETLVDNFRQTESAIINALIGPDVEDTQFPICSDRDRIYRVFETFKSLLKKFSSHLALYFNESGFSEDLDSINFPFAQLSQKVLVSVLLIYPDLHPSYICDLMDIFNGTVLKSYVMRAAVLGQNYNGFTMGSLSQVPFDLGPHQDSLLNQSRLTRASLQAEKGLSLSLTESILSPLDVLSRHKNDSSFSSL